MSTILAIGRFDTNIARRERTTALPKTSRASAEQGLPPNENEGVSNLPKPKP